MKKFKILCLSLSLLAGTISSFSMPILPEASAATKRRSTTPTWSKAIKIPHRAWIPNRKQKPTTVLLCIHGLGFNSNSFADFGKRFASRGVAVYAIDVRGFGQWHKKNNNQEIDFEACMTDLEESVNNIRKYYPTSQICLVGESMGGAIATEFVGRYPEKVDSVIQSVPGDQFSGGWKTGFLVMANYLEDKDEPMDISSKVINLSTSDRQLRNKLKNDDLMRLELTPEELKQFKAFMSGVKDAAALNETTSCLFIVGTKDKLVKPEGTVELYNETSCDDKTLLMLGDAEHLMLEEGQMTRELFSIIHTWLQNHRRQK